MWYVTWFHSMPALLIALFLVGQSPAPNTPATAGGVDSDGDGLTDFQELHKYHTDPTKRDTRGNGVQDSDLQQRREFAYSVRAVIRVMPPYNQSTMNDDYQDVRVLSETKDYVEIEVVTYPLNTNATAIAANPNWRKVDAGMKQFLAPGVTTNWDERMRNDLLAELAKADIDPAKLSDRETVERVSRWLFLRSRSRSMFCTNFVHFPDRRPAVFPGLERAFEREKGDPKWTEAEQFAHELLGKEMFYNKSCGTCTSAAVAQATVLRAVGIPTRIILTIPLVDASDPEQVELAQKQLTHQKVRNTVLAGLSAAGNSFANHTYLEVFVDGRWRRLNYNKLGQNVLDPRYFGLMIHVHTFNDLSEANLAPTWGVRYALEKRDAVFQHSNPYRTISLDDHLGQYANVPNAPAPEHTAITITRLYWPESEGTSELVRNARSCASGVRFFIHGEEWFDDAGDYLQYRPFLSGVDLNFVLRAQGQPEIPCRASSLFLTLASQSIREFEVVIPAHEFGKMAKGVAYTLHPTNAKAGYAWKVKDGLTLTRRSTAEDKFDALLERLERLENRVLELEKRNR
jgi:hypothetical protein